MPYPALGAYAFGAQSAKGTVASSFPWTAGFTADASKPDLATKPYYTGYSRSLTTQLATRYQYKGDVTVVLTQGATSALIFYAMGGTDTVTGSATPYTHTMSLASGDLSWISVQRQFKLASYAENIMDCKIDSFSFSAKAGEIIPVKLAFLGLTARASIASPATPTFETLGPATYAMSAVTLDVDSTAIAGYAQDWDIEFKNQLEWVPQPGSLIGAGIVPKVRQVSGKISPTFEADDDLVTNIYGLSTDDDPSLPAGVLEAGALTVTTTWSTNETQELSLPNIQFTAADPVLNTDGKTLMVPLTFTAAIDSGNDEFGLVVVNSTDTAFA